MYKRIYACKNILDAEMIISLLKEGGFHPLDLQTSPHVAIAGADTYYHVQIPDQEYESVKEFLINQGHKEVL